MANILSFETILLSFVSLLFIKIVLSYVIKDNKRKLPPSPPALPVIGHLHLLKQPLHHSLIRISNRYGPITSLRFGSRQALIISSRELAELCLTTHDLAFANRPQLPSLMLPHMIGTANYGPHWRNYRQIAKEELLSIQRIQASTDMRTTEVRNMVYRLFRSMMMVAGKQLCSGDVKDLDDMKQYREAIEDWFKLSGAAKPEDFFPLLRMLDLNGVMKKMRHATDINEAMVQKLIEEHRRGVGKRKTMMGHMLELQPENQKQHLRFMPTWETRDWYKSLTWQIFHIFSAYSRSLSDFTQVLLFCPHMSHVKKSQSEVSTFPKELC